MHRIFILQNGFGGNKWIKNMNIEHYTSYFHDGSIIEIKHSGNKIEILMESAEITEEDIQDNILLSKRNTIKGKLHLQRIKSIKENDRVFPKIFEMKSEDAEISHFKIIKNKILFHIIWDSYPPNPPIHEFSTIEIEAEKIWWENIPDLVNPYW